MKKILAILFAVAFVVPAAQAQQDYKYTIGGQLGYGYNKNNAADIETQSVLVAPEFGVKLCDDTNVGVGLSYLYNRSKGWFYAPYKETISTNAFGGYLFGEKAIVTVGSLKLFLRGDIGMETSKTDDVNRRNEYYAEISPNLQYPLTERLTLTVSSDVLSLGVRYGRQAGESETSFGFNTGRNSDLPYAASSDIKVGLKYAF